MARADRGFNRILDELRRSDRAGSAPHTRSPLVNPLASAAPPIGDGSPRASGAAGHWDQAAAWIAELPDDPSRARPKDAPSDNPEAIAAELGLTDGLGIAELARIRRRFMWANHPDRRTDAPRELVSRRAAIANMLLDRARAAIKNREG